MGEGKGFKGLRGRDYGVALKKEMKKKKKQRDDVHARHFRMLNVNGLKLRLF